MSKKNKDDNLTEHADIDKVINNIFHYNNEFIL